MSKNIAHEFGITSIVNYLRKSRQDLEMERKTGEDTLDSQKKLMDRVLAEYGIPYDQRLEIGSGDKISTRPVFQQVIKDIEIDKFDAIAVKEISRMGRGSYTDMGIIYDLIVDKRLFIITPWKIYDPTNPADLRQIRFELFMSREEFETTRERLSGGRLTSAMEGKWVAGPPPFGFNYNSKTKKLEINEDEAESIRAIYDFYAHGIILNDGKRKLVQFRALSTYLSRIGIKTPKGKDDWHPTALNRILRNERYIGVLRYNTTKRTSDGQQIPRPAEEHIVIENAHPPIIDMETWNIVQNRMKNRDTTNTKLDFDPCELAGICVCIKCGRKMVRQYSVQNYKKIDGTTTKYHKEFLWCTTVGCSSVKYRSIEEDLLETLRQLRDLDDKALSDTIERITVNDKKSGEITPEDIEKSIKDKKQRLIKRREFIFEKHENGIYSDEEFIERKEVIDKEIEDLEKLSFEPIEDETENTFDSDLIKENITDLLDEYKNTENKTNRNRLLRSVFDHVVVEVLRRGRGRTPAIHKIAPHLKSSFLTMKRT